MAANRETPHPSGITVRHRPHPWRNFMTGSTLIMAGATGAGINGCVEQYARDGYKAEVLEKISDPRPDTEIASTRVDELRKLENVVPSHAEERARYDAELARAQEKRDADYLFAAAEAGKKHSVPYAAAKGAATGLGVGAAGVGAAFLYNSIRRRGKKYGAGGVSIELSPPSRIETIDINADGTNLVIQYRPEYGLNDTGFVKAAQKLNLKYNFGHTVDPHTVPLSVWESADLRESKHFGFITELVEEREITSTQANYIKEVFRGMAAEYHRHHAAAQPVLAR